MAYVILLTLELMSKHVCVGVGVFACVCLCVRLRVLFVRSAD